MGARIVKNAKLNWVRLPIDNLENCRELGGYGTSEGEQTKWHAFLRSGEMSRLTPEDVAFLREYGVRTVIDLRRSDEIEKHPNVLAGESFCRYHNIPLFGGQTAEGEVQWTGEISLGDVYVEWLEHSPAVKEIFEVISEAEEGTVVFHCQAGKDRTGVVAMLLLALAGVEEKDIVSNYEVTYTNLRSMLEKYAVDNKYGTEVLLSRREYILKAYEHIMDNYQSVERYLMVRGVSEDVMERVKGRLVAESEPAALGV